MDRRDPGAGRRARPVPGAGQQGHPPGGAAGPDPVRHRADPAHREVACCSSSRGAGTGSSAPPTPTGSWTRRTRRPARPTSTTCSSTSTRCSSTPLTRGRRGGRLRRAAAAAVRRVGVDVEAVPRARGGALGAGAGGRRRRQVHDLPGDGQGRGGRGGARAGRQGAGVGAPTRCRCSARRATRRCGTDARAGPPLRPARGAHRAPARPLRLADRRGARPGRAPTRRWASRWPGRRDYLRAEIVYAASHEGARHLDDVLARRTRISIETFDRGIVVGRGGGPADGSGAGLERGAGAARGRALPQAGRGRAGEPAQPDDETADAARLGAPEVVPLA